MKPHMTDVVSQEDLFLFQKIEMVVHEMPEVDLGVDLRGEKVLVSCHMIARALAHLFSWLEVKRGYSLIIDPYPVALVGGPIMVHAGFITTPWRTLYIEAKLANLGGLAFRKHVKLVEKSMLSIAVR